MLIYLLLILNYDKIILYKFFVKKNVLFFECLNIMYDIFIRSFVSVVLGFN